MTLQIQNADVNLEVIMAEDQGSVKAKSSFVTLFRITPKVIKDKVFLQILATANNANTNLTDSLLQLTEITPSGFPRTESNGGFIGTYHNETYAIPKK